MNTIETMIQEYEQLKKERDAAAAQLEVYRNKMHELATQLGVDIGRLLRMTVVQCEHERQMWNFGKEVVYITLEDQVTDK